MIRKISDEGQTVGVVDERSEIGACYQGVAQNDLGIQTDVMDACEKGQGMNMLIRSMAPDVIAKRTRLEAKKMWKPYFSVPIVAAAFLQRPMERTKNRYLRIPICGRSSTKRCSSAT